MGSRRTIALLVLAVIAGLPAFALRVLCIGRACDERAEAGPRVPFCSLPEQTRRLVAAGYRDGRSPDIIAVTRSARAIVSVPTQPGLRVSLLTTAAPGPVPISFAGTGVAPGASIPPGTGLDDIAPTLARVMGLHRPHPEVRTGQAIDGVATGETPRLVVQVVFKGLGSADLSALDRVLDGPSTDEAVAGSVPLDPAAVLTTIGTGGLPFQHGITGTVVREERGMLVRAWGGRAPVSVIATLADDLDERLGQRPHIGLVAADGSDRGLIGGDWYIDVDEDDVVISNDPVAAARRILVRGYGKDRIPDLLAVVVQGRRGAPGTIVSDIVGAAERASRGSVAIAVAATGVATEPGPSVPARTLRDAIEESVGADVVEAVSPGGFFLDQKALTLHGVSRDAVIDALASSRGEDGARLVTDVFPGIAVSFARYC